MTEVPQDAVPPTDPRPQPPREPEPSECCGSGCVPCVYDNYWERVAIYEEELREWEARHPDAGSVT